MAFDRGEEAISQLRIDRLAGGPALAVRRTEVACGAGQARWLGDGRPARHSAVQRPAWRAKWSVRLRRLRLPASQPPLYRGWRGGEGSHVNAVAGEHCLKGCRS